MRQLRLRHKVSELVVNVAAYVTPAARDYMKEHCINLTVRGQEPVNTEIRPAQAMEKCYSTEDGQKLTEKPEHMTHLYGNVLVAKNHPHIVFRGRLDSLEAAIVELQTLSDGPVVEELEEVLGFCRTMLSCEVTGKPLPEMQLLGLSQQELREQSHHPKRCFNRGHILPGRHLGWLGAALNRLRTQSREVELAAIDAFCTPNGEIQRPDLLQGLNRLSSALYITMFRHTVENKTERGQSKWKNKLSNR